MKSKSSKIFGNNIFHVSVFIFPPKSIVIPRRLVINNRFPVLSLLTFSHINMFVLFLLLLLFCCCCFFSRFDAHVSALVNSVLYITNISDVYMFTSLTTNIENVL